MGALERYVTAQAESFLVPAMPTFTYKKAPKKVHPVAASLPEDFRTIRHCPEDPLFTLSPLPTCPPPFTPGTHLTQERLGDLNLNHFDFLWPEEFKLAQHVLKINKKALAWTEDERGRFRNDYFSSRSQPLRTHPESIRTSPFPAASPTTSSTSSRRRSPLVFTSPLTPRTAQDGSASRRRMAHS